MAIRWEDEPSATNDVDELRKEFRERLYVPVTAPSRSKWGVMLTYAQIEAIHEAMRELEKTVWSPGTFGTFDEEDVHKCLAKIRAALAGEKASDDGSP